MGGDIGAITILFVGGVVVFKLIFWFIDIIDDE